MHAHLEALTPGSDAHRQIDLKHHMHNHSLHTLTSIQKTYSIHTRSIPIPTHAIQYWTFPKMRGYDLSQQRLG